MNLIKLILRQLKKIKFLVKIKKKNQVNCISIDKFFEKKIPKLI